MDDVLLGGLLTLAGAAVGAISAWFVKRVEINNMREQAQIERQASYRREQEQRVDRFNEVRRTAYVTFLAHATRVADVSKEISRMSSSASPELMDRNAGAWSEFIESWAEVAILGPKEVLSAAQELHDALTNMVEQTDEYLTSRKWSPEVDTHFKRCEGRRVKARDMFQVAASAAVAVSVGVVPD